MAFFQASGQPKTFVMRDEVACDDVRIAMGVPLVGMLDSAGQLCGTLWRMRNGERMQVASRAMSRGEPLRVAFSQATKGGGVAADMCVFAVMQQPGEVVQVPVHVMVMGSTETVH